MTAPATTPRPPAVPDAPRALADLAADVERTLTDVRGMPIDQRTRALALKDAVEAFHRQGLVTLVRTLREDPRGRELLHELVDDPGVYALFALHGIVKADLRTRVARVVESVRPYMQSHGGDVALVDVEADTVRVRLSGACNGCSQSAVTLRSTVEAALREHVPEIAHIVVVPTEPAATGGALVSLTRAGRDAGWITGPRLEEVREAVPFRVDLADGRSVVLLRLDDQVQAFWNACAHLGLAIDGGTVDREARTITCPWHGFRFDCTTGECLTAPQAQLEPVPLRVDHGTIALRVTG